MNPIGGRGTLYGAGAYFLWGLFPLYFRLLDDSGAVEILMHRVLWSLVVCVVLITALRSWPQVSAVLHSGRQLLILSVAAVAIGANWGIYIYAVNSGQVVEASLGYFINPLVTVALGVLLLGERLHPLQWVAVVVGVLAVAVLTVDYGHLPYISLSLAGTFGLYGLLKNRVGGQVGALAGLTTETLVLAPFAILAVAVLTVRGDATFTDDPPWQALLLISAGLVTVAPLLLFAAAARRVPLTTMGLLQYLTPVLQLFCGVLILGEHMPPSRWAGFGLVWVGLVVLTFDSLQTARRHHSARPTSDLAAPDQLETASVVSPGTGG
jgi:chloramphenicol-sensitive protein RarD